MVLNWHCYDRPNRFSIKKDTVEILTSGWVGQANYTGPWGTSLATAESGMLRFTPVAGSIYTLLVEAGPASTDNPASDTYDVTLTC